MDHCTELGPLPPSPALTAEGWAQWLYGALCVLSWGSSHPSPVSDRNHPFLWLSMWDCRCQECCHVHWVLMGWSWNDLGSLALWLWANAFNILSSHFLFYEMYVIIDPSSQRWVHVKMYKCVHVLSLTHDKLWLNISFNYTQVILIVAREGDGDTCAPEVNLLS